MIQAKEEVRRILEQLPDHATYDEIQYQLYVRRAIQQGRKDVDQGRVVSRDEADRRMRECLEN